MSESDLLGSTPWSQESRTEKGRSWAKLGFEMRTQTLQGSAGALEGVRRPETKSWALVLLIPTRVLRLPQSIEID